ncbi:hypothetical protein [Fimbriiglobus ruber]|uniref:Uncharacterized protein n=1 Tax=Fimbriiglobus ruber TaxID=1908690 RepID=A0A225E8L5_9BACT|nr:hypothetical protein [Fimbriiglobus ruber]OWK47108.1 hypothetical protein FRUB_00807 [Fimbriiglobus ruber]
MVLVNQLHEAATNVANDSELEAHVARLTRAAYNVALRHGISGSFAELELAIWREMREIVLEREAECTSVDSQIE